jgi:hypothetical protein
MALSVLFWPAGTWGWAFAVSPMVTVLADAQSTAQPGLSFSAAISQVTMAQLLLQLYDLFTERQSAMSRHARHGDDGILRVSDQIERADKC